MRARRTPDYALLAVLAGCLLTAAAQFSNGSRIVGDGMQYYVYARALAVHGDLTLHPADLPAPGATPTILQAEYVRFARMHGGHVVTQTPAGVSLLWFPAVAATHIVLTVLHRAGWDAAPPADGFSVPYHVAAGLMTLLGGLWAVGAGFTIARAQSGPAAAALAALLTLYATPLFHYLAHDASMSEGPSWFAVTLAFWIWWRVRHGAEGRGWWAAWGAAASLAMIMRYTQVFAFGPAAWELAARWRAARKAQRRALLRDGAAFALGAAPLLVVQAAIWRATTGSIRGEHYVTGIQTWAQFEPWFVLWSARHGLFALHPAWLLGVIGGVLLARRERAWAGGLLLAFAYLLYINQLPMDYWAGHSYGARRFVPLTLLALVGLAEVLARARAAVARRPWAVVVLAAVPLVALTVSTQKDYRRAEGSRHLPVVQTTKVLDSLQKVFVVTGWPGSWPANLVWAARHHTTPDRYDLGSALFIDDPEDLCAPTTDPARQRIEFGHARVPAVVREQPAAWSPAGLRVAGTTTVWVNRIQHPRDARAELRFTAGAGGSEVVVAVNGRPAAAGRFGPGPGVLRWEAPAGEWGRGTNDLTITAGRPVTLTRLDLLTIDSTAPR